MGRKEVCFLVFKTAFVFIAFILPTILPAKPNNLFRHLKVSDIDHALPKQHFSFRFNNPTKNILPIKVEGKQTFLRSRDDGLKTQRKKIMLYPGQDVEIETYAPEDFGDKKTVVIYIDDQKIQWTVKTISSN